MIQGVVSFCMWLCGFPNTIYKDTALFPTYFLSIFQREVDYVCTGLLLLHLSIYFYMSATPFF